MSAQPNQKPMPEPDWHRYEQLKRELVQRAKSQAEYEAGLREIIRICGV